MSIDELLKQFTKKEIQEAKDKMKHCGCSICCVTYLAYKKKISLSDNILDKMFVHDKRLDWQWLKILCQPLR